MPNFTSVSGQRAWSDISPQKNTSKRVETGAANRPLAESRLSGRKIEIRTGARVIRARGPWVGFKKFFTSVGHGISSGLHKIGLHNLARSQTAINERLLRHAEHKFDRHVNRMVEDLANKPNLSPEDVSNRLKEITKQAEKITKLDPSVSKRALSERFEKNLNESLNALAKDAVARKDFAKLRAVTSAFQKDGALHNIADEFTFNSDSHRFGLMAADRHEQGLPPTIYGKSAPMTASDYVNAGIVEPDNEDQHAFGQSLIAKMQNMNGTVSSQLEHAKKDAGWLELGPEKASSSMTQNIQKSLNQQASQDIKRQKLSVESNPFKSANEPQNDGVHGAMVRDFGRSTYVVNGRKISSPSSSNSDQQAKTAKSRLTKAGIPDDHLAVISSVAHQGFFAPIQQESAMLAMQRGLQNQSGGPTSPFDISVGDGQMNQGGGQMSGVRFEINATNKPGVYTLKAQSEKPMQNLTDFSSGKAEASPSDPKHSRYRYEMEAIIDVNKPDQPVQLTRSPEVAITHVPPGN